MPNSNRGWVIGVVALAGLALIAVVVAISVASSTESGGDDSDGNDAGPPLSHGAEKVIVWYSGLQGVPQAEAGAGQCEVMKLIVEHAITAGSGEPLTLSYDQARAMTGPAGSLTVTLRSAAYNYPGYGPDDDSAAIEEELVSAGRSCVDYLEGATVGDN